MGKKLKSVFYIEKVPGNILKGLGWIKVNTDAAQRFDIPEKYTETVKIKNYEPHCCPIYPEDISEYILFEHKPYHYVYLPKVRNSNNKFSVQFEQELVTLFAQKSLTVKAVREWVKTWASPEAKLITPGKRTLTLDGDSTTESAFVYFIFNIDSKAIKIGMAKNVEKRLQSIQTSSPIALELLHTIQLDSVEDAQKLEYVLHQRFSHLRMNGEWFEANEELRTYIKHAPVSYSQSLDLSEPKPYRSVPLSEL